MYKCGNCGLEVAITPEGEKIKACVCKAPIIVEMSAVATGKSRMEA